MKPLHCILAIASVAMALPMTAAAGQRAPGTGGAVVVPNAVGDPLIAIYRASGVRDDGSAAGTGTATSIHCTSFSGVTETVRITIRNYDNTLLAQTSYNIGVQSTVTASTHNTNVFAEDITLFETGAFANQAYLSIHATSTNILCSAQVVDAASMTPNGWALHLVRFNNMAGAAGE